MATIHTNDLPKHKGELELAKLIINGGHESLHAWFSLDYIPGARDVDMFFIEPQIGAFCVEVKAVSLEMIESISYRQWKISGRDPDAGPIQQAYAAGFGLREYLRSRVSNIPFIVATACFPKISRQKWNEAWSGTEFSEGFSERLLFADDFSSGPQILLDRLSLIFQYPPIRAGHRLDKASPRKNWWTAEQTINLIANALDPVSRPKPTANDWERLKAIETGITKETLKDFPTCDQCYGIFTGYPGTGKTFRLLQLVFANAFDGRRTLFCCFNKTLGSDIRRLVSFSAQLRHAHEYPVIVDIFELAAQDFHAVGLPFVDSNDHDEWLHLVVQELRDSSKIGASNGFDFIAMDEAQELNQAERELLLLHLNPGGSLVFALGKGQELYNERQVFSIEDARVLFASIDGSVKPIKKELRRNFRNTQNVYFAAHLFFECFPNSDKVPEELLRIRERRKNSSLNFDFYREAGGALEVFTVDSSSLPSPVEHGFAFDQEELMKRAYFDFLTREFDLLMEQHSPIDLLVLVPSEKSVNAHWARLALAQFRAERNIGFTDLTTENNRRNLGERDKLRLCTFHSARGLEGARVLVFGFEQVDHMAKQLGFSANNLGFVVLSRSLFSTTVVFESISGRCKQMVEKIAFELNRVPNSRIAR